MIIHVMGLGPTAKEFTPDGNVRIGVNDVQGCQYQVCVDRPAAFFKAFNKHRFMKIVNLRLQGTHAYDVHWFKKFFTQIDEWKEYVDLSDHPNWKDHNVVELIQLKAVHAHNDRWNQFIPSSNNSPFVACGIAYKIFGATEIRLWGVDFLDHPHLNGEMREAAVKDFRLLQKILNKKGCVILPHEKSYLYNKI